MRVLIIDDEQDMRMIVRYAMAEEGEVEVAEAESGAEGLRVAEDLRPDVILMDVKMGSMDGSAVLAALKQNSATACIPVILITATTDSRELTRLKKLGAIGILPKPFDPVTLTEQVLDILRKK
jgi:two-component system, OmpR family, response regulator